MYQVTFYKTYSVPDVRNEREAIELAKMKLEEEVALQSEMSRTSSVFERRVKKL